MGANIFNVNGEPVNSVDEFMGKIVDNKISNVLFFPNEMKIDGNKYLTFRSVEFNNISFKDTIFTRCSFKKCNFTDCLFLGCHITKTDFDKCNFINCNTSKMTIDDSRLDPRSFDKNFNFIEDANLAIDLYRTLYDLAKKTHQPMYSRYALYKFNKSKELQLEFTLKSGDIDKYTYTVEKYKYSLHDLISGYGLKRHRLIVCLVVYILYFSTFNYLLNENVFGRLDNGENVVKNIIDSIYFSFVSFTTIGFGDIAPKTSFGKIAVMFESAGGIMMIAHGLNIFTNGDN